MYFISSFQSCHNLEISGICDDLRRCWDNAGTWWKLQVSLVYKMHLSPVILFVSTQRWSESHFINSLTNFIDFLAPAAAHPETICSKNILLTRILTPLFFEKKRGSNLAMLVLVSGGAWEVLWEFCSGARTWQRCARTRCNFRKKGWVWCGGTSRKGPWGTVAALTAVLVLMSHWFH